MSLFSAFPFTHQTIERFIVAMGEFFSGIHVQKFDTNGNKIQDYICPIEYAPKDKWISRVREQNDLTGPQVKMTLPRMAFELIDIRYAPERRIGVNGTYAIGTIPATSTTPSYRGKIYAPTPYDCVFNLYILAKDQKNDSQQIIEQILPYFQPYTIIKYLILPEYNITKDVPVSMQKFELEDTFAGSPEDIRTVTTTFTFSAQMDFFGPMLITDAIIKQININMATVPFTPTTVPSVVVTETVTPPTAAVTDIYTVSQTIIENMT